MSWDCRFIPMAVGDALCFPVYWSIIRYDDEINDYSRRMSHGAEGVCTGTYVIIIGVAEAEATCLAWRIQKIGEEFTSRLRNGSKY